MQSSIVGANSWLLSETSQSTLCRKPLVRLKSQIDPFTVAVLRDQTWVIRLLLEASLESLRLDQAELSLVIQLNVQLQV
jgi:hypothetical protein